MTRVTKSKHVILPAATVKKKNNTMGLTLIGSGRLRKLSQNETLRIKEGWKLLQQQWPDVCRASPCPPPSLLQWVRNCYQTSLFLSEA